MKNTIALSGIAALVFGTVGVATTANAADPIPTPVVAPVAMVEEAPPAFSWTGGYIGGHAGLGRGALDNGTSCWKQSRVITVNTESGTDSEEYREYYPAYFIVEEPGDDIDWDGNCRWPVAWGALGDPDIDWGEDGFVKHAVGVPTPISGYLIGAQIGFNLQLGQGRVGFVIGAEVSASMTSLSSQLNGVIEICHCFEIAWNSEFRINYLATATLRAGLALGKVLIYGEGGLALANATWVNTLGFSDTVTDHGYVYGAGIEAAVANNVSLFFEWNRVVIPEHRFIGSIDAFVIPLPTGIDVSSTTDIFKVGFNIAIGRDH
jgi:opacity protein-like surface antigen